MKRIIERTDYFATSCKSCGRTLTNPGYHRQSVYCCGKYRRWYDTREISYEYDDGRDEKGRFHHKPGIVQGTMKKVVTIEGGN